MSININNTGFIILNFQVNVSKFGDKVVFCTSVEPENGETTIEHLHLYILNGGSPFFALVNAAWNNYNIVSIVS